MDDDDNFFSRLDRDDNAFQNRLRNAPRDDDDVPMPVVPPLFEEDEEETPLQQLIRHWMNERHAPDILPVAEDVLAGLLDHIRRQVGEMLYPILRFKRGFMDVVMLQSETVQLLLSDPSSSSEEHFRIMLAQTEVERVKFVVRSYLRTRLFKVSNVSVPCCIPSRK